MYLGSSRSYNRLQWISIYSLWVFAEALSLAPFAYSIFAIVMWILGDMLGPAFFIGIIPGFTMFETIIRLIRRSKHPWGVGDFVSYGPMHYHVRQIHLLHAVMRCEDRAAAMSHKSVKLCCMKTRTALDGTTVYQDPKSNFFQFTGCGCILAYVWAILCDMFVVSIFLFSMWFMYWAGGKAAVSFVIGALLPLSIFNMRSRSRIKGGGEFADEVILAGSTWLVMDVYGTFRLRLFVHYEMIVEKNCEYM
jgi:hypothetical protein